MRVLQVTLEHIYEWDSDKALAEAKVAERIAERRAVLDRLHIRNSHLEDNQLKALTIIVSGDQLIELLMAKQKPEIINDTTFGGDALAGVVDRLEAVVAKTEAFGAALPDVQSNYNEKVEVYTPGAGLMLFNSTMLLEDSCSDDLQTALDQGWRIIAACPQPNARRPDYIMGRYDPEHKPANTSAKRGRDLD